MRLLTLLSPALLAATAFASESDVPSSVSSGEVPSPATPSSSAAPEEPTPIGQLYTAQWKDADIPASQRKCVSKSTYKAGIYKLGEMYPALKTWAPQLKVFYHKQHYEGTWEGVDHHGTDRELLKMDYEELPFGVREWITRNPKQRHYSVQDEVVFFAPGAIYPVLPLWVEEPEGETIGECEGMYSIIRGGEMWYGELGLMREQVSLRILRITRRRPRMVLCSGRCRMRPRASTKSNSPSKRSRSSRQPGTRSATSCRFHNRRSTSLHPKSAIRVSSGAFIENNSSILFVLPLQSLPLP